MIPTATKAAESGDSAEINKLLADSRAEAVELKADSESMESFTRSALNWGSYASQLEMIKGHVNKAGELLAKLQNVKTTGSPWQQTAINRIAPLLKEMADNTQAAIKHLNDNQNRVHSPEFKDYVKANYELATDLEALIREFVDYSNAKEKVEGLGTRLETGR
jgi:hypothetical protein